MATGKEIQVDEGEYTRIHNAILEALAKVRLSGAEFRCLMFLLRKTYGWHKKEDVISLSQWAEGVDGKRPHVLTTLKKLIEKKIIYCRLDSGQVPTYGFNKYVEQWEGVEVDSERGKRFQKVLLPEQVTVTRTGNSTVTYTGNKTVTCIGTHKRKKERIKDTPANAGAPAKKPTEQDRIRGLLEAHFQETTGLPAPKAQTVNQRKAAGSLWWGPLREIAELSGWDEAAGRELITAAVERMDGLTISSPKSIVQVATSIFAEKKRTNGSHSRRFHEVY